MRGEIANAEAPCAFGRWCDPARQPVDERRRQCTAVQWVDKPAKCPVREGIDAAVSVAADHWQACGGRLEERDSEAFAGARHGKDRCERQAGAEILGSDLAREDYVFGDSGLSGKGSETGRI